MGPLNFAAICIIAGCSFISYLIQLSCPVKRLHHRVYLNSDCQKDLQMCLKFLEGWNGYSLFLDNHRSGPLKLELYTDAAASTGYGGYFQGAWFASRWPDEIQNMMKDGICMAYLELYPIVVAAILWGHLWSRK